MELKQTHIPGCFEVQPKVHEDIRGRFVKVFHENVFRDHGLETAFAEEYYSVSRRNVLRGLHFQTPPEDHVKLVYCTRGLVMDAVVDLRRGSPTFGQHLTLTLSAEKGNMLYIPKGLAHGFFVLGDEASLTYKVTTAYSPQHDTGILWSSAGISWPCADPILAERDRSFHPLNSFISPFLLEETP